MYQAKVATSKIADPDSHGKQTGVSLRQSTRQIEIGLAWGRMARVAAL
jgi:hypothetical protein